jgi:hypothetical protein
VTVIVPTSVRSGRGMGMRQAPRLTVLMLLLLGVLCAVCLPAQAQPEPEFIGEVHALTADGGWVPLDKELGEKTSGMSWSSNSWNATSLEVEGGKANTRFAPGEGLSLIVRAADNAVDPVAAVSVYAFKSKRRSRSIVLREDNTGTFMKSREGAKDVVRFTGAKHGASSYLLTLGDLAPGEYGVVVANPATGESDRVVVACFGIDSRNEGK